MCTMKVFFFHTQDTSNTEQSHVGNTRIVFNCVKYSGLGCSFECELLGTMGYFYQRGQKCASFAGGGSA